MYRGFFAGGTGAEAAVASLDAKAAVAVLPPPGPVRGKPTSAAAIRRAAAAEEPGTWDLIKGLLSKPSFQVHTANSLSDGHSSCVTQRCTSCAFDDQLAITFDKISVLLELKQLASCMRRRSLSRAP